MIVSSGDLALQGVTRHQAGNYTCTASNVEGDGDSNVVELKVMCEYRDEWGKDMLICGISAHMPLYAAHCVLADP